MKRQLVVVFSLGDHGLGMSLREVLERQELNVLLDEEVSDKELEEKGINSSMGNEYSEVDARDGRNAHVWVVEGSMDMREIDIVRSEASLQRQAIEVYSLSRRPDNDVFTIASIFANLDRPPLYVGTPDASTSTQHRSEVDSTPKAKPFALSNSAWSSSPSSATSRGLSPKIAQALEQLESEPQRTAKTILRAEYQEEEGGESWIEDERVIGADEGSNGAINEEEPSDSEAILVDLEDGLEEPIEDATTGSEVSHPESTSTRSQATASSSSFKARPAPPPPTAQPRMTKSASLRLGIPLPPTTPRTKSTSSVETLSSLSSTTPRPVSAPRSLAAPAFAPRMSKTAALRTGQALPSPGQTPRPAKRQSISTSERAALDRLTRRQSVHLPVNPAPPPVQVRVSKSAMLRMGIEVPPPRSRSRQSSTTSTLASGTSEDTEVVNTNRRQSVSASLKSLREPTVAPRATKSSALRVGTSVEASTPSSRGRPIAILDDNASQATSTSASSDGPHGHSRRASIQVASTKPPRVEVRMSRAALLRNGQAVESPVARRENSFPNYEGVPGHKRRESISVASMSRPPVHAPRLNRTALLRQNGSTSTPINDDRTASPAPSHRSASALSGRSQPTSMRSKSPEKMPTKTTTPRRNRTVELRQKALASATGGGGSTKASM